MVSNDIGFSWVGSLTSTLVDLITRSSAGMTAEQLGEKLGCRCHSVLVRLYRQGKLQRQKLGYSYVYLAVDPPCGQSATGHAERTAGPTSSGNCAIGFGGVYPPSRFQLQAVGQCNRTPHAHYRRRGPDRKTFQQYGLKKRYGLWRQSLAGAELLPESIVPGDLALCIVSPPADDPVRSGKGHVPLRRATGRAEDTAQNRTAYDWTVHRPRDIASMSDLSQHFWF